ncbi:hypothetical protein ACLBX9_26335 [Methylobacterium sp. A49B]
MGHDLDPDLAARIGLPPRSGSLIDGAMTSMVADALLGQRDGCAVSASLNKNKYRGLTRYHPAMRYSIVRRALAQLEARVLLQVEKGLRWPAGRGRQTSFRASPLLASLAGDEPQLLRNAPTELVILKDETKQLVSYVDTDRTQAMRCDLREQNEAIGGTEIRLTAPDVVWAEDGFVSVPDAMKLADGTVAARTFRPDAKHMSRIFNNRSFEQGGRWYGHWSQGLNKKRRRQITIGGDPVELLDFGASHLSILYAWVGVPLDGDPYDVPGIERSDAKLGLLIAINAASPRRAMMALAGQFALKDGLPTDSFPPGPYRIRAGNVLRAIKARHRVIADSFCSGVGVHLQYHEAEVLTSVMRLARQRGILCLPIHDELIVQRQYACTVEDMMMQSWADRFGTFAVI